jgi:hypothetical protein
MLSTSLKSVLHHVRYFPLWSALTVLRWRAFDLRSRGLGTTFGVIMGPRNGRVLLRRRPAVTYSPARQPASVLPGAA